jgi:hypothetical protein
MLLTKMHKAFLFTNLFLHNLTKLYKTRHSYKTLHNCHETLQHYTKLYKHKHYNTLQDFIELSKTLEDFTKLNETLHNSTQLYTILHNSIPNFAKTFTRFDKTIQNTKLHTTLQNFAKQRLDKT